jgi:peptide/nickel transport system substrate-binding protein
MTAEPAQLDPQGTPSSGLSLVMPYLYDTLAVQDKNNNIYPLLAESWETAEDGLAITMTLKSGVTFHDGTPLNAEAVDFSFERFREKGIRSPIYGGVSSISSIEVIDELTLRFGFDAPTANFWSTITMPYAAIISPDSARSYDETGEGHVIGSGPMMLGEWRTGQSLLLVRNPDYAWGPAMMNNTGQTYIDALEFKVIPDATTQLTALEAGEVDVIFINQPSHKLQLADNADVNLVDAELASLIYMGFNCQKAPFDEVPVRQALSHGINKAQIVQLALGGLGVEAFAPLPPSLLGFDPTLKEYELGYDPELAQSLLADAGFARTADGGWERDGVALEGTLITSTRAPNETIATLIQAQLAAIGVPIEIQQLDSRAVMAATTEGQFDLLLWRYDWNDPDALAIFLGSDRIGRTNRVAYGNPDVDALLAQGASELDVDARVQLYVEAQKLILNDAPWQPLYNPIDVVAARSSVQDIKIGHMARMLINDTYITAE